MKIDHYQVLKLPRNATGEEIKAAYRRYALLYHPDKNNSPDAALKFRQIYEAYVILKDKTPPKSDKNHQNWKNYHTEEEEEEESSTHSSWSNNSFRKNNFSKESSSTFTEKKEPYLPQDPPVHHDLFVSLENLLEGAIKKIKITKDALSWNGVTLIQTSKIIKVRIEPGHRIGKQIIFQEEGNQRPGITPADVIFTIREKSHALYTRDGVDIILVINISLQEILFGNTIQIPLLGGKTKDFSLADLNNTNGVNVVANEGLPLTKYPYKRGNLIVKFNTPLRGLF